MEVKIKNHEADILGDAMGLTKKDMHELAKKTAKHYATYLESIFDDEDDKLTDNHIAENKLFFDVIKECETLEQALFVAFNFKITVKAILAHGLKTLIEKN